MLRSSSIIIIGLGLFFWAVSGCVKAPSVEEQLTEIDNLLQTDPRKAIGSLYSIDNKRLKYSEAAYYNLLLTIAQHKNHIPFTSDSLISFSQRWFESHGDSYNYARACFYNGLVTWLMKRDNASAYESMRKALRILSDDPVGDAKLEALICAYLGQVNDYQTFNLPEAAVYYRRAVELEGRLNNGRNLISDYCNLLVCYVKMGEASQARETLNALDSVQSVFPECRLEKAKNAKALYYLHLASDLDSALFYGLSYNPPPGDSAAKAFVLSEIYQRKGLWQEAISYARDAMNNSRDSDTLSFHVYYQNLADLYSQLGEADSTARYAQLAYEALRESVTKKTEKRVLELEKQYDLAAKEAELVRERNRWQLLLTMLIALLAITGLLFWQWRLLRQNVDLQERQDMKDTVAMSIIHAVVSTYAGINKRLTVIHNLPDGERQDALNRLIQDNKTNVAKNLSAAIEENYDTLPKYVRRTIALLDGAQQKAVFILTEIGFSPGEIGKMLGISSNQVRTVKTAVRDRISTSPDALKRDIVRLQIMQMGRRVHNSKNGRL